MDFAPSARSDELKAKLVEFDNEIVRPAEPIYRAQRDESGDPHFPPPVMEELKVEARKRDLWNLFLPEADHGARLSNLEYAPLCEVMGTSPLLGEATNCSAPDTGNMEILAQFGTPLQQEQWLAPAARRRDPLVLRDDRAVGRVVATPPTSRAASSATATTT